MAFQAKIAEAFVDIKANTKNYERGVKGVKSSLGGLAKKASLTALVVGGGVLALKGIKSVTQAFNDETQAIAKLNAVLKSTGEASGFSSKEMQGLASELQKTTTFSNDALINTQALLATFTNISGDNFREATKMAVEMSAVFGQDLKSSAVQLGKALNDPIKGIGALSRVGVSFNAQQTKTIKGLVAMGKAAEAQTMILKIMKEQGLEGAAAAMRNTFGGAIKGLANDLQDMGKALIRAFGGGGAANVINAFTKKVQEATALIKKLTSTDRFQKFLINMKFVMKEVWLAIKAPWVLQMALLKDVFFALKKWVADPFIDLIKILGKVSGKLFDIAEELAGKFADTLPDGFKHTKQAIKDLTAEEKSNREERLKGLAAIGAETDKVTDGVVKGAKAEAEALKKANKERSTAVTDAEGLVALAQGFADAKIEIAGANGANGATGSGSVAPSTSTASTTSRSINKVNEIWTEILDAIKEGNQTLTSIERNTEEFSVYA